MIEKLAQLDTEVGSSTRSLMESIQNGLNNSLVNIDKKTILQRGRNGFQFALQFGQGKRRDFPRVLIPDFSLLSDLQLLLS